MSASRTRSLAAVAATIAGLCLPAAAIGATGAAGAGAIIDCGYFNGSVWTPRPRLGYGYHLTTRNVGCGVARGFSRRYRGTDTYYPAWRCREINGTRATTSAASPAAA